MKRLVIMLALAGTAAVPAAAIQAPAPAPAPAPSSPSQARPALPQTDRGFLSFYDQVNYNGHEYEIEGPRRVFRWDYNIRAIAIHPGDRWQLCARPRFEGCIVLDRSVPDASLVGITASIGSVRPAPEGAPRQDNE